MKRMLESVNSAGTGGTLEGYGQFMKEFKIYNFPHVQDGDQRPCDKFKALKRESTGVTQMKLEIFQEQRRDLAGHKQTVVLLKEFLSLMETNIETLILTSRIPILKPSYEVIWGDYLA